MGYLTLNKDVVKGKSLALIFRDKEQDKYHIFNESGDCLGHHLLTKRERYRICEFTNAQCVFAHGDFGLDDTVYKQKLNSFINS